MFRSTILTALLLPHSRLPYNKITKLLPHQPTPHHVTHQLRRLAATPGGSTALRILTELGLALDRHELPIDYQRRRRVAATTELIDKPTWNKLSRACGLHVGRERRLDHARRYLYELITGGNLTTAPTTYRLLEGDARIDHAEFCATLPISLAHQLTSHASALLARAGITDEPLTWEPPADWVTTTTWPGAEPAATDPATVHTALREQWESASHNHWAPTHATARRLGISLNHLRHVLRQHPITNAPYALRRPGAIIAETGQPHRTQPHPTSATPVFVVDPNWLREQYHRWGRTLANIAAEIGCRAPTLRAFAQHHDIPRRPRSGGSTYIHTTTIDNPAHLPEPLRNALTGHNARQRLDRFLRTTNEPSLTKAAAGLGIPQNTLTSQLKKLEQACGGQLLQRNPRPHPVGPLTPLGEQLCQQAKHHLKPATPQ